MAFAFKTWIRRLRQATPYLGNSHRREDAEDEYAVVVLRSAAFLTRSRPCTAVPSYTDANRRGASNAGRREAWELDRIQSGADLPISFAAYGDYGVAVEIETDQRHVLAQQFDVLESAEHRFDAGQPGNGLLILAIGVSEGKADARSHRLASPHFVEQVVHGIGTVLDVQLEALCVRARGCLGTRASN
jgi:hypothetical protein